MSDRTPQRESFADGEVHMKLGDQWFYRGNRSPRWLAVHDRADVTLSGISDPVPAICWQFLEEIARLRASVEKRSKAMTNGESRTDDKYARAPTPWTEEAQDHCLKCGLDFVLAEDARELERKLFETQGLLGAANNALAGQAALLSAKEQQPVAWLKERGDDQRRHVELHPHVADWMKKEGGWTVTPLYRAPASAIRRSE
jgi:hypothetical protein